MRESIGGAWLMTIVISFVILFSGFLALSINYSKAYRVKDGIVERLQKYNGITCEALNDINGYIGKIGYASRGYCPDEYLSTSDGKQIAYGVNKKTNIEEIKSLAVKKLYNYCILKNNAKVTGVDVIRGSYFKVAVFFSINLPIFEHNNLFMVTGETNYIPFPTSDSTSCTFS